MSTPNWLANAIGALPEREPSPLHRATEIVDAMPVPQESADWHLPARREMLIAMALAALAGNPAVIITPRGRVVWTDAAPTRHDSGPGQRTTPLSSTRRRAADEMRDNLHQPHWHVTLDRIEENARHLRREELRRLATALYGPDWVSPAARDLGVSLRAVQRWAAGERGEAPPPGALADMRQLIAGPPGDNRRSELRAWLATLEGIAGDA